MIASGYAALPMRIPAIRIAAALALATALLAGCGDDDDEQSQKKPAVRGCEPVDKPAPRKADLAPPEETVRRGEKLTAVVKTSCGSFEIALDTGQAPKTASSFAYLAREGFYDGLDFQRIAPDFVIQGGDPLGNGTGGPGFSIDEKPPPNLAYTKGVVAMAKTAAEPPGRSGSQFFVVIAADAGLSPDYALVGSVSRGIDVVERIGSLGTPSEQPRQTVLIERITIERG
jgi:peptidyl-prolyl cis-trans isomerase B (cyclophilin B)